MVSGVTDMVLNITIELFQRNGSRNGVEKDTPSLLNLAEAK